MWARKKLRISGKTYPEFSKKYYETVCTGAIDAETGNLLRIYPITLRYRSEPFKTFDWIEAEIARNSADPRPESYKIRQDAISIVGHVDTKNAWAERNKWVLRPSNVFGSVEALLEAQARERTSLGVVRPKEVTDVYVKKKPESDRREWQEKQAEALAQKDLFVDPDTMHKDLAYMPIQYRIKFRCRDAKCKTGHDMSVLDWGVYALSRKQYASRGAAMAERDVIAKISECLNARHDAHFFLGNTKQHPQSFMIVGIYYPPKADPMAPRNGKLEQTLKLPGFDN